MNKIEKMMQEMCPDGVEWKKLREVFYTKTGYTPSKQKKEYWENGIINWFTIEDIRARGRILEFSNIKVSSSAIKKELFKKNSIVLSIIATIGEYALIETDFIINQQFIVFSLKNEFINKINMKFMRYYFFKISEYCKLNKRVGNVPTVDIDKILKIEIPIPPLKIQEEIVKILDIFEKCATELQSELQQRYKQYNYYRDMMLSEEYLNEISEKININSNRFLKKFKLKDIAEITRGKRLVRSELEETGKFSVFQNSLTPLGYYHDKNFTGDKTCVISAGAAGDIFYIDDDFWAADDVFVINSDNLLNKYIYYFLLSKQSLIKSKVRKASVPRLSRDEIEKIEILVPNIELQEKVVQILDKFQNYINETKGLLPKEIEQRKKQYEYYREKLLTFGTDIAERERERESKTSI